MALVPVKDLSSKSAQVKQLMKDFSNSGGFVARELGRSAEIFRDMIKDKQCVKFLSFPADIISTGTRGIIKEMLQDKAVDVVSTTCGTLDHDIARAFGDYYHGAWLMDEEKLQKKGLHRLGNVLVPQKTYGAQVEKFMKEQLAELQKRGVKEISTHELCWELGKAMPKTSLLYWIAKRKIPMVIPGPTDGAIGYQLWMWQQRNKLKLNLFKDESLLNRIVWDAKRSGALIVGGGISKHHVIWWSQFKTGAGGRTGLDYAVYITTAAEWDGSLSGAHPREAISWGKLNAKAKHATVHCDATIALPLLWMAAKQ